MRFLLNTASLVLLASFLSEMSLAQKTMSAFASLQRVRRPRPLGARDEHSQEVRHSVDHCDDYCVHCSLDGHSDCLRGSRQARRFQCGHLFMVNRRT